MIKLMTINADPVMVGSGILVTPSFWFLLSEAKNFEAKKRIVWDYARGSPASARKPIQTKAACGRKQFPRSRDTFGWIHGARTLALVLNMHQVRSASDKVSVEACLPTLGLFQSI